MYHEQVAKYTSDHLRSHIGAYLAEIEAGFTGTDTLHLEVPKVIDVASQVGGMIKDFDKILPMYGIDCLNKVQSQDDASLWSYEYIGQINGLVRANSREAVDKLVHRHSAAVEKYIRAHRYLHQTEFSGFLLVEFVFVATEWSGAEYLGEENDREIWIAGFSTNVSWFTSEEGPDDHA